MVRAGAVRVVDDIGVARRKFARKSPPDLIDLCTERPNVQGLRHALRHQAALSVKNRKGEVLALLNDGGVAGPQHVKCQLARHLMRGMMNDLEIDGVHVGSPDDLSERPSALSGFMDRNDSP